MLAVISGVLRPWDASSNPACFKQIQSHPLSTVLYYKDKNPIKMKKAQQIIEVLAGVVESGSLFFCAYGAAVARH